MTQIPKILLFGLLFFILCLFLVISGMKNAVAAREEFSSKLINQSKQAKSLGYILVKTRTWPETGCVLDSGKERVNPGENSIFRVKKARACDQAGIGYSIYSVDDVKNEHLIGYLSHRFRDGRFSMQISLFCEGSECIFRDLNPTQSR